jgi:hypothetical protein
MCPADFVAFFRLSPALFISLVFGTMMKPWNFATNVSWERNVYQCGTGHQATFFLDI